MYRGASAHAPHEQRPPRADPKRAWLDAIMSQARQTDASTSSTSSGLVSRPAMLPADMYQEQMEMDDTTLAATMARAFDRLVGEQACCFIARGVCHLCGASDHNLIPVVNFCPSFHVNHSLCREHLRSMHRVRMEDIFAGKNRPTVSKRALQCTVCSRSCSCSTCQLEKQHELSKYRRWLAGEREYELGGDERAARNEHGVPRFRTPVPPPTEHLQAAYGGPSASSRPGYLTTDEFQGNHGPPHQREQYPPRPHEAPLPGYDAPWNSEFVRGDELGMITSLPAAAKPPSLPFRGAKRAAKDTPMLSVQSTSLPPPIHAIGEPMESPSAAHVMNCAESEKSLVRLLTTLNQEVQEVPAVAEPKDSRLPQAPQPRSKNASSRSQTTYSEDHRSALRNDVGPTQNHGYYADASVAEAGGSASSTMLNRNSKRKRAVIAHAASETSSESSATHARGGRRLSTQKRGGEVGITASRGVGSQSVIAPSSRAAGRGKSADARQRTTPKAAHGGRKRGADMSNNAYPSSASEKKGAAGFRRDSSRRTSESASSQNRRLKRQPVRAREEYDDESDEESEIDTNLDYCEVCQAAGDLVCCDVCPRSFHLACLKLDESELPEGDWQCAECMKPSFFKRYLAVVHMKQSVYGKCVETIRCLKSHPFSKQFLSPVKNIEHYQSIVKHPMDLTTIETKLKTDKYTKGSTGPRGEKVIDIETFANDVRLVWANCKLFNDDGSGIVRAADELAGGFEDIYDHLRQYVAAIEKQAASKTASVPSRSRAPSQASSDRSSRSVSPPSKAGDGAQTHQQMDEGEDVNKTTPLTAAQVEREGKSATDSQKRNSEGTAEIPTSDSGVAAGVAASEAPSATAAFGDEEAA